MRAPAVSRRPGGCLLPCGGVWVAAVPVYFSGNEHYGGDDEEEADGSDEQGVVFGLEAYPEPEIGCGHYAGHGQGGAPAWGDFGGVDAEEKGYGGCGGEVRGVELPMFGEGQKEKVEHDVRGTGEEVLHRMDANPAEDFEEEEHDKGNDENQDSVFH